MTSQGFKARGLGWKPDMPDIRDSLLTIALPKKRLEALPAAVDLRSQCPDVYDQGELGSCTAQSACALAQYLLAKQKAAVFPPSRLFLYYVTREIENTIMVDAGATLRNTMKALNKRGTCHEKNWLYDVEKFSQKPPRVAYYDAETHQSVVYERVPQDEYVMKLILASGFPFIFGFGVYPSLYKVGSEAIVTLPNEGERLLGGHAVMCVGYDDDSKLFVIRNSWGESWGKAGYHFMPYEYLLRSDLSRDFWTIRLMEAA